MNIFQQRIHQFRELLKQNNIDAYIAYHSDPHQSEYPIPFYLERQWLSGFEGSAGTLVITADTVAIWTDARYFLQLGEQMKEWPDFQLMKMGQENTPSIGQWLTQVLGEKATVASNPALITLAQYQELAKQLQTQHINLILPPDLLGQVWTTDRTQSSQDQAIIQDEKLSGEPISSKINKIRQSLVSQEVDSFIISALDELAWTFNIRGNDIACNPVLVSYAYISTKELILFIDPCKISDELKDILASENIQIANYSTLLSFLSQLPQGEQMGIEASKLNMSVYNALPQHLCKKEITNPIPLLKGIKNSTEIAGFREALRLDSIALTEVFMWIEEQMKEKQPITEMDVMKKAYDCRAQSPAFFCESFCPITAYAAHGAIVHYRANEATNVHLQEGAFFLFDSGGQYRMGTTDITRTIYLGTPSQEEKKDYSLVLKAHIALAKAVFPDGTRGVQLDAICRQPLWQHARDYGHGTGHGVGSFLNVHEGPQSIRKEDNGIKHVPGMVSSNEPGLYRANKYGIRLENLILCTHHQNSEFGTYYQFETLTLFPFDTKSIDSSLLNQDEIQWLNNYHQEVYETIAPHLNTKAKNWLQEKCKTIY